MNGGSFSGGDSVPYLNLEGLEVSLETYMGDFRTHLQGLLKPGWEGKELDSKVFDSGITNKLVAIFPKEKGLKQSREDVVLLRINGTGTEKFISRTDELVSISALHSAGLCPPVFAKLANGLCYGFLPGNQLGIEEVREEGISAKVARLLARLHCVEIPEHFRGREPQVWAKVSGGWGSKVRGQRLREVGVFGRKGREEFRE